MQNHQNSLINSRSNNVYAKTNNVAKIISVRKLPKPVYFIESPYDDTVLVGIDATITDIILNENLISILNWYDTIRQRNFLISQIIHENDRFIFKRSDQEGGDVYCFTPMNLKIYHEKIKQHLSEQTDFADEADLITAFLSTIQNES